MNQSVDLIVIGGGATGAGIALDAALRGLSVTLFEQNDFGEGTSSRSTKLVHGGVRYLEAAIKHFDIEQWKLVREGLRERKIFLRNAAHLAHPIELITPLYKWYELPYVYAGLFLYDLISGRSSLGRSRLLTAKTALRRNSAIDPQALKGAVSYFDGAFNDARMVIALIQSAEAAGAAVHNHHAVTQLIKDTDGDIVGVDVHDKLTDTHLQHAATSVINATGPFADTLRQLDDPSASPLVETSSGIHIVLPARFLPSSLGVMIPKTSDGRLLFALPYQGYCLVGTTDQPSALDTHPPVTEEEIDFLLEHLNHYFALKASRKDILSTFSGLRPLIATEANASTASLVRESEYRFSTSGLLTVAGGKWTAYRAMAQKAVDLILEHNPSLSSRPCATAEHSLIGSQTSRQETLKHLNHHPQLAPLSKHLYAHYGDQSLHIADHAQHTDDLVPLLDSPPITRAEMRYAVRKEHAQKPLDFLVRRCGLGLVERKKALTLLPEIITIMAEEFQWNSQKKNEMENEAEHLLSTSI